MENIYDIRLKEEMLYILPEKKMMSNINASILSKCVIIINLYYSEMLNESCKYINRIPNGIKVLCISSKQDILDKAAKNIIHTNIEYILKKNRGRDVSALLVTAREVVKEYRYFCWLHDKKCKFESEQNEIKRWSVGLWDNSILSQDYIQSVIEIFESNNKIGILLPPEPAGDYSYAWYGDAWTNEKNYIQCKRLIERYNLKVEIDRNIPPLLGTTMWARTSSLIKLFETDWQYEDFPDEPMPSDGTISHALERCYPYFAQDAGYYVGTVMCDHYAAWLLLWAQNSMRYMFKILADSYSVNSLHQLKSVAKQAELVKSIFLRREKVLFYGTGIYSNNLLKVAEKMGYKPDGFVVSDGRRENRTFQGYEVFELNEIVSEQYLVVIATSYAIQDEIAQILEERGLYNYVKGVL